MISLPFVLWFVLLFDGVNVCLGDCHGCTRFHAFSFR